MCGIVGCVLKDGNKNVAPILFDCITKLEYRGYDSIGLATYDKSIHVKKDKGKINDVDQELDLCDMKGNLGIAHVRWATHGDPSKLNAHPHLDGKNTVAIVHNGIIENYSKIKSDLIAEGHIFKSDTDTEVIPHLIQKYMGENLDLEHAIRKTIEILGGGLCDCCNIFV